MIFAKRYKVLIVVVLMLILALAIAVRELGDPLHRTARRDWKNQAIATLSQRLRDEQWLASAKNALGRGAASRPSEGGWVGDEWVVMKNGDWIVCQNICSKQNSRIKDLFIGRGSDGKWYYSTFHFCVGKVVLRMEPQPESLARFVDAYWLAPFDGQSDGCLNSTWTGSEPWGSDKLQKAPTSRPAR